ncbi:GntR family transcriptional regulator [Naasia lichenicola]|uniref:GntR family transcriptional regulator n=1 Tax=Naasia lichenicola TaxID=2565933 RepID=A0A4S4FHV7_9MICO|nr:GntR family transcriptional regulator [Naasia lichenicola]THG29404.1 GntR family transcriptional regulator [Naasia lichenicola]
MSGEAAVLGDSVAAELRTSIVDQTDAPGSTITEAAVAVRFGVARPTARMAIDRLVAEGLLRREPHHAAKVPVLSREDITDLYDSRATVEGAAVGSLARSGTIPAEALAAHRAIQAMHAGDTFAHEDIAFHRALVNGQPSGRLARMHGLLMGEIELCIGQVQSYSLLDPQEIAAQHQAILTAVIAGDAAQSEQLTRAHISYSRDRLLAHYDSTHPSPR